MKHRMFIIAKGSEIYVQAEAARRHVALTDMSYDSVNDQTTAFASLDDRLAIVDWFCQSNSIPASAGELLWYTEKREG